VITQGDRDFSKLILLREKLAEYDAVLVDTPDNVIALINRRSLLAQLDKVLSRQFQVIQGGKSVSDVSST